MAGWFTPTEAGAIGALGALILMLLSAVPLPHARYDLLLQTGKCPRQHLLPADHRADVFSRMLSLSGLPGLLTT